MHTTGTVQSGCIDCHGGNARMQAAGAVAKSAARIRAGQEAGASASRAFPSCGAVPRIRCGPMTDWLKESKEYIQFVNPGDLRVAPETCGSAGCHAKEVRAVQTSMMTHGAMLWQAALYNNGGVSV